MDAMLHMADTRNIVETRRTPRGTLLRWFLLAGTPWWIACSGGPASGGAPAPISDVPRRIVSLAPSITETLYLVGAGDRLAGVTDFCDYPPAAATLPRVGGYTTPNLENIVALRPDLVLLLPEHEAALDPLRALKIPVRAIRPVGIAGMLNAIDAIGVAVGMEERARRVVKELRARVDSVRVRVNGRPRPRVLVTVGRNMGTGALRDLFAVGRDGFLDELIAEAGGENVMTGGAAYPAVSVEGVLHCDPEVIIEIAPELAVGVAEGEQVLAEWRVAASVTAVRSRRVHVFGGTHVARPGPRFIFILESMARVFHPAAFGVGQ